MKTIKKGTYEKIDELKSHKSEFGFCKGYKPNYHPIETQSIENKDIKHESIYLFSHSQEELLKLKEELIEKIMEIDSDLEIGFRQFTGEYPEYSTKFHY